MFESTTRSMILRSAVVVFLTAMLASAAGGQMAPRSPASTAVSSGPTTTVWHVVRQGENLHSITALYLGSSDRWRENHQLNPEIANPHRIQPGQRLRVLLGEQVPDRAAVLMQLANRVQSLLNPRPWERSTANEVLRDSDAVRTYENSSAELVLRGRGSLIVTEESIVYLRTGRPQVERRRPSQIEIEVGQADYEVADTATSSTARAAEAVEIVLGASKAQPTADADGNLFTRARIDASNASQLMVYGGTSSLETPGGAVALETGTGTSVAPSGEASPPERLLEAPELHEPAAGARVPVTDATFSWQALDGAASYLVEVCADPRCAELVQRVADIEGPSTKIAGLPTGDLYWRATARSRSGLDGYPSDVQPMTTTTEPPTPPDTEAPWARVRFLGPQVTIPGRFVVGPESTITVESGDVGDAGVDSTVTKIDGETVAASGLAAPWAIGDHSLGVEVVDAAGNRFEHEPVPFTYDEVPPTLRWGRDPGSMIGEARGIEGDEPDRVSTATNDRRLRFEWAPGPDRSWRGFVGHVGSPKEAPTIGIRPARGAYRLIGADVVISRARPLWLSAEDEHCRAVHLSALIIRDGDGSVSMIVDAVDLLGNATRQVWPLVATSAKEARDAAR